MREFQERRRIKKLLHSRYAIVALSILVLILCRAVWGIYVKYEKSREIAEKMESDLALLVAREKSLSQSIEAFNTPEGKERELRDRFGLVKPGEKMIVLVDDSVQVKTGTNEINNSWWGRFLDAIGL